MSDGHRRRIGARHVLGAGLTAAAAVTGGWIAREQPSSQGFPLHLDDKGYAIPSKPVSREFQQLLKKVQFPDEGESVQTFANLAAADALLKEPGVAFGLIQKEFTDERQNDVNAYNQLANGAQQVTVPSIKWQMKRYEVKNDNGDIGNVVVAFNDEGAFIYRNVAVQDGRYTLSPDQRAGGFDRSGPTGTDSPGFEQAENLSRVLYGQDKPSAGMSY